MSVAVLPWFNPDDALVYVSNIVHLTVVGRWFQMNKKLVHFDRYFGLQVPVIDQPRHYAKRFDGVSMGKKNLLQVLCVIRMV